jgi:hypothetical protein
MKRYFDNHLNITFQKDFKFLFKIINQLQGELDLRLRGSYFNLYYKGNSLAAVKPKKTGYEIVIHEKFARNVFDQDKRISTPVRSGSYFRYWVEPKLLHPFFQANHLKKLGSNIKNVNYSEEIMFEQMLITDNMNNNDLIIIDRQITEKLLKNRLDLLALQNVGGNQFRFLVLEVKLGNNAELRDKVGTQLGGYISHIDKHFDAWKLNYEKVYQQLKQTGIYPKWPHSNIEIIKPVEGWVVVGHYSGIAQGAIKNLKSVYPNIIVKQLVNAL